MAHAHSMCWHCYTSSDELRSHLREEGPYTAREQEPQVECWTPVSVYTANLRAAA